MSRRETPGPKWYPLYNDDGYDDPFSENGVAVHDDGGISIYDAIGFEAELTKSQVDSLRNILNAMVGNLDSADEPDDALAALGVELNGNPMAEPQAVVASVPVPVKTT